MNRLRLAWRKSRERWCPATGWEAGHREIPLPLGTHYCAWDYCACWMGKCIACGREAFHSYGFDEIR